MVHAVEFHSVSKSYAVYHSAGDRLKELAALQRKSYHREFRALDDVSLSIDKGEVFCIIGENGSGKSTLLQLIAGILRPTSGSVEVAGRVSALLELGSGFNPEFTGRENVYLNGAILGFSTREIDAKYPSIESFAEIGEFMNRSVKTYSSGMVVRLAFSVAIHADPEILLVDEALSVGDAYFRQRCLRRVHELRAAGVTIVFVSHSIGDVKAIGDRTLWLEKGRIRCLGDTETVVSDYLQAMAEKDAPAPVAKPAYVEGIPNVDHRHGDGRAEIIGVAVLDDQGRPAALLQPLTRALVRISARANARLAHPVVGFTLRNHLGIDFAGSDTDREHVLLPAMEPGDVCTVDFNLDLPDLYPAFFSFSAGIWERRDAANPAGIRKQGDAADSTGIREQGDAADPAGICERRDAADPVGVREQGDAVDPAGIWERRDAADPVGVREQGDAADPVGVREQGDAVDPVGIREQGGAAESVTIRESGNAAEAASDWIDNAVTVQIGGGEAQVYGYLHLPCRVELEAGVD